MSRRLNNWIEAYLAYTENSEPPKLYHEWTAMSVVASVLERKCLLQWGELTFYPNMYIVLVGPPGKCRKGTAMKVGEKMIREMGVNMAAEAITREALIRELRECGEFDIDPESGDASNHASLTIFSKELTVFLGYNNTTLMSDITDWYDCSDEWTYRTKNMGTDEIVGVWVNLIGATTPDLIRSALPQDTIGSGLSSRIVFVYEEEKEKVVATPFLSEEDQELREDLISDLSKIYTMRGEFRVTEKFIEKWIAWYNYQEDNPPFADDNFAGYMSRRPTHIMKMCIIISAATREDMIITGDTFDSALSLLKRTEKKMARTFSGYGRSDTSELVSKVMRIIALEGTIKMKELLKRVHTDIGTMDDLMNVISILVNIGFCRHDASNKVVSYIEGSGVPGYD